MAHFLTQTQLYRLIQRELPVDAYPDGQPSAFFSTADSDATAKVYATAYTNLQRIYDNFFPQSADEKIDDWVKKMFIGNSFDVGITLQDKRDRIIAKIRKQPEITQWEILKLVASYLPAGKFVQVRENKCPTPLTLTEIYGMDPGYDYDFEDLGIDSSLWCDVVHDQGWKLGVDLLGDTTYLSKYGYLPIIIPQIKAFGYQIRIFDYAVSGLSYDQMVREVNSAEPARSLHFIKQNQDLAAFGLIVPVTNVDQFSGVDCITIDPASDTGYSGRTT